MTKIPTRGPSVATAAPTRTKKIMVKRLQLPSSPGCM